MDVHGINDNTCPANSTEPSKFEWGVLTATASMMMAPMLCILFLGAPTRALQMDPVHGNPQCCAQDVFYMMSCAILIQSGLSVEVPLVMQGEVHSAREFQGADGDMKYTVEGTNAAIGGVLLGLGVRLLERFRLQLGEVRRRLALRGADVARGGGPRRGELHGAVERADVLHLGAELGAHGGDG